jgi:hypothetical protein
MEEVLSKFIPNFKLENIERDKEFSKGLIMSLIEEKINISSSPFLCSILEYFLKINNNENNKYKLILIGEKESLNYYSTIGRKMGVNLLKKGNGFIFVDVNSSFTKLLSTQLPLEENYPETFNPVRKTEEEYIECDHKLIDYKNMDKFYSNTFDKIKKLIDGIKSKENNKNDFIVIFDKINDSSLQSLDEFMKYTFYNGINLIFTINKELNEDNVIKYVEYLSDISIALKNNESGFSKDLSGIIDINIKMDQREDKKSYRYNLKTNEIKIFSHINI